MTCCPAIMTADLGIQPRFQPLELDTGESGEIRQDTAPASPPDTAGMTAEEAYDAYDHAWKVADGCQDVKEIDEASCPRQAYEGCPNGFTGAQREFVAHILLDHYFKVIGRA